MKIYPTLDDQVYKVLDTLDNWIREQYKSRKENWIEAHVGEVFVHYCHTFLSKSREFESWYTFNEIKPRYITVEFNCLGITNMAITGRDTSNAHLRMLSSKVITQLVILNKNRSDNTILTSKHSVGIRGELELDTKILDKYKF